MAGTEAFCPQQGLRRLLQAAGLPYSAIPAGLAVDGIVADSRAVRPGSLFIAYRGLHSDGHRFIGAAVAAGAAAVVAEEAPPEPLPIPLVLVADGRSAWAWLCAAWHGYPGRQLLLAGVTGTDGKTTTSALLHHLLVANGVATGLLSTVYARIGERLLDTGLHTSTPPPNEVQALLAEMLRGGCHAAVLESTSEGLAQKRLEGCDFDLAILTNVTHDHLYYHGTLAAYREAKALLFGYLGASARKPGVAKTAIINRDDPAHDYFAAIPAGRHVSYGQAGADVTLRVLAQSPDSQEVALATPWGRCRASLPLTGLYNAYNSAAALAAACSWGVPLEAACAALGSFPGVPGRMERVDLGQPFRVIVDFAHTANALEQALRAARAFTTGRLIVVFGCAGERDRLKREPMARVAVELADHAVFTAEDPRTESLAAILAQMAAAALAVGAREGEGFSVVEDRAAAIATAIAQARPGDSVLLCGKGHEQSMCYGREERPWGERAAATMALQGLGYSG